MRLNESLSPKRWLGRWSSKRRLTPVHWSNRTGRCRPESDGIQTGDTCRLISPDGAPLLTGTIQDCFLKEGRRCLTLRLDRPEHPIERAVVGGERDVLLQVGDAPARRMTIVSLLIEPDVGGNCVLREVDQAPSAL